MHENIINFNDNRKIFLSVNDLVQTLFERVISIFNIHGIERVVVTQVLKTRHLMEVSVVYQSFLLVILITVTYLSYIFSFSSRL